MDRIDKIAIRLGVIGAALAIAGVVIGRPELSGGIEGAYFNRTIGAPAFPDPLVAPAPSGPGSLDPHDGSLWVGAGIALVAACAVLLLTRRSRAH